MSTLPTGTVTFLFTDIEGSTVLWQRHPEAMAAVIARHDALLKEIVAAHAGTVFRTVGDAVNAAFAAPADAVAAALAMQRAVATEPWGEDIVLRVRVGIHTGTVDIQGKEYAGHTLNRVARITAAGHGGQILLSAATAELVRQTPPPGTTFRDLGEYRLKDLILPERIYVVEAPDLPSEFPRLKTLDRPRTNLPVRRDALVGRDAEIEAATALLVREDVGLVTFTGAGGTGKTSLASAAGQALLDRFPDGVWFVSLVPIIDPALVPSAIMSALGVREEGSRSHLQTLRDFLASKRILLILDNLEQVVSAAPLVAELLQGAPGLTVLVTSRVPLHLRQERELPIAPLSLPDRGTGDDITKLSQYAAVQLFAARAQAVKPDFAVTDENAAAVAEICARLDGLPLAIELAAARIRVLTPQALLRRLDRRLPVLTGGAHDLPERQQTMEAAIAWSYDLLAKEEQTVYRRLSVFAGGFTFEEAEAVCGSDDADLLDGISSMVDKSLIRQEEVNGEPRFSMLQTIREYGLARLHECDEGGTFQRRHAQYFADLADRLEREAWAIGPGAVIRKAQSDWDNIRAALDWSQSQLGETGIALRLVSALASLWAFGGHSAEGYVRAEAVLARPDVEEHPDEWAGALITLGALHEMRGESDRAVQHLSRSEEILRRLGDDAQLSQIVQWLGMTAISHGDINGARQRFTESRDLARAQHLPWAEATALSFLAEVMAAHENLDEVRSIAEESEAQYRVLHDPWGMARVQKLLAGIAWLEGDYAEAHRLCEAAIGPLRAAGERWNLTRTLVRMGVIQFDEGQYEGAEGMFLESLSIWHDLANDDGMILCLAGLAAVAAAQGQTDRARRLYAAEPLHQPDRAVILDTLSQREYQHLLDRTREYLGDVQPGTVPLQQVVGGILDSDV